MSNDELLFKSLMEAGEKAGVGNMTPKQAGAWFAERIAAGMVPSWMLEELGYTHKAETLQ